MDRFKRFLAKFALYFGIFSIVIAVIMGLAAGAEYIRQVFGVTYALLLVFLTFGSGSLRSDRLAQQRDGRLTLDKP